MCSAEPRIASALARVVVIRSYWKNWVMSVRRSALRWPTFRPRCFPKTLCRIVPPFSLSTRHRAVESAGPGYLTKISWAELARRFAQARHFVILWLIAFFLEACHQFVQRFLAEVADRQHRVGSAIQHFEHFANRGDPGTLERVEHAHAEVQRFDRRVELLLVPGILFRFGFLATGYRHRRHGVHARDNDQVVHQNLGGFAHRLFGADGAIGPDFENQLV